MAGLLCLCGNPMGNGSTPSESIAEIYDEHALKKSCDDHLELWELSDDNFEYWYCQKCKRITVIDIPTGRYLRSYSRVIEESHPILGELTEWKELFYWSDKEFYEAIEEGTNKNILVSEFLEKHPSRYFVRISPAQDCVEIFSKVTKEYLFSYHRDPEPDFMKERRP